MTNAHDIAEKVNGLAMQNRPVFVALLGALTALFVSGLVLAVWAVRSGPVGPALLDDFPGLEVARLHVLQWSVFTSFVSFLIFVLVTACWSSAPSWLRTLGLSRLTLNLSKRLAQGFAPGSSRLYWGIVGVAALVVNAAMLWDMPIVACLEPDTVGYLQPSMIRSSGYMVLVDAVVALTGDLRWIYPVQLNFMLVSFAVLGWAVRGMLNSFGAGLFVALASMSGSGMLILAPAVMTEAVFVGLIGLHLAAVMWALKSPTWTALLLAGLSTGVMILMRPNGVSFVLSVVFLIYMLRPYWRRTAIGFLTPVVVLVSAQGVYHLNTFGFFGLHQFGGVSLVGNFAPLIHADMGGKHPDLNVKLDEALDRFSHFPKFDDRGYPYEMARIAALTSAGSIYQVILPEIRRELGIPQPKAVAFEQVLRVNQVAGELAQAAVLDNPWGAFQIVTSNFINDWHLTLPVRVPMSIYFPRCVAMSLDLADHHSQLVGEHLDTGVYTSPQVVQGMKDIGQEGVRGIELPRLIFSTVQMPLGYLTLAVAVFGFVAGLVKGPQASQALQVLSLGALSLMAGYGVISLGNTAHTRYTVVFDPVVFMMLSAIFVIVVRRLTSQNET